MAPIGTINMSIARPGVSPLHPPVKPAAPQVNAGMQQAIRDTGNQTQSPGNSTLFSQGDPLKRMQRIESEIQSMPPLPKNGTQADMLNAIQQNQGHMLRLQAEMNNVQLEVELGSKVVEEATGGARTLLQAQS